MSCAHGPQVPSRAPLRGGRIVTSHQLGLSSYPGSFQLSPDRCRLQMRRPVWMSRCHLDENSASRVYRTFKWHFRIQFQQLILQTIDGNVSFNQSNYPFALSYRPLWEFTCPGLPQNPSIRSAHFTFIRFLTRRIWRHKCGRSFEKFRFVVPLYVDCYVEVLSSFTFIKGMVVNPKDLQNQWLSSFSLRHRRRKHTTHCALGDTVIASRALMSGALRRNIGAATINAAHAFCSIRPMTSRSLATTGCAPSTTTSNSARGSEGSTHSTCCRRTSRTPRGASLRRWK